MKSYARDLDLNLLRVFLVVADTGSVTDAAAQLYLTQPAVSAALKRLHAAVGAPLFARQGRRLALTARGASLRARAAPLLEALIEAATAPEAFDPATSERVVRLGLSDLFDRLLLPALLRRFAERAPKLRVVAREVQFRTVGAALASGAVDLAVGVADELPSGVAREVLYHGSFSLLFDPAHARFGRAPSLAQYLAHRHVIVSYNGDLRGVVEDILGVTRDVRVSLSSFDAVGAVLEGSALVATVPTVVARALAAAHPALRVAKLPREFALRGSAIELLYRTSTADDPLLRFVRDEVSAVARAMSRSR